MQAGPADIADAKVTSLNLPDPVTLPGHITGGENQHRFSALTAQFASADKTAVLRQLSVVCRIGKYQELSKPIVSQGNLIYYSLFIYPLKLNRMAEITVRETANEMLSSARRKRGPQQ